MLSKLTNLKVSMLLGQTPIPTARIYGNRYYYLAQMFDVPATWPQQAHVPYAATINSRC